jgi:hypothetical protein
VNCKTLTSARRQGAWRWLPVGREQIGALVIRVEEADGVAHLHRHGRLRERGVRDACRLLGNGRHRFGFEGHAWTSLVAL